jgi:hypothetical protein
MGFMTKYGTLWGQIPQTSGKIFWVAASASYYVEGNYYVASDSNDGLSPERAFLTVDYAVGKCTANVGDTIVLLPGSHTTTTTITVDVAGITIVGLMGGARHAARHMAAGGSKMRVSVTTSTASTDVFTVTAADVEIAYLHVIPVAGAAAISISNAADRAYVHDCTFNMTTATNTATFGISFPLGTGTTTANDDSIIRNCYWYVSDNQGPAIRAAGTLIGCSIESSTFYLAGTTAWDDVIEVTLAGSMGNHFRDCDFITQGSGTVMTDCIDVTGATTDGGHQAYRCYFPAGSDGFEASATADIYCAECYLATTTSGAVTGSA